MIKDIFKKDINRKIEGVIKADIFTDDAVFNEVDEYVVTQELLSKFENFFDIYSTTIGRPTESIGVWISGFFGSGKSHLLKILSYILSSRSIHSDIIGELFLEKIDTDEFELRANIKKALSINTDTILFNIDQKADTGAATRGENAILQVFLKVFNEHCGYYPKQASIANFERKLDKRGNYQAFKDKFKQINGDNWENQRDALDFIIDEAAQAFSAVENISFESATEQLNRLDENFSISIEDFAKEVKEYIDTKDKNYRIVFLVDEVGQFIGDNTSVMLNLQTMVETLASTCLGQAWVIVTSQSAIKDLISSHNGLENDFSKIMGRFDTKLDLTSQNANEVIQKRLLAKNDSSISTLTSLYNTNQNSLRSIIHFSDRGLQYQNYKDQDDFNISYPFVPYQFELFQRSMVGLSNNEMFQGKHASIGERSMLNVVQKVAKDISKENIGTLASFDYFFDGISNVIRPEQMQQITFAKNSFDPFTLKILKILFLVKYVKEFNTTIENITTLLVDSLDVNIAQLQDKVKNSLSQLLNQIYIQKVGDIYEFLTNVEKDMETEIKQVDINDIDTTKELADWIYSDIIKTDKVRYEGNKHDYAFTRKQDGAKVKNGDEELMLDIITPLNNEEYTEDRLIHKSMAENDVIINLGQDYEFVQDLKLYLQTKKFIPLRQGGNLSDQERYILATKGTDNQKRKKELIEKIKNKFENSQTYYNGSRLSISSIDPKKMVENIFNQIIPVFYTSINMLDSKYNENHIAQIINDTTDLFGSSDDTLDPASTEVLSKIKRAAMSSQTITIAQIISTYKSKPFGWYQSGIQCLLAKLYARNLITITLNGTIQDKLQAIATLTNSRSFQAIIKPVKKVDESKLKDAKEILSELFSEVSFDSMSAMELLEKTKELSKNRISTLSNYQNLDYKFTKNLSSYIEPYKEFIDANIENIVEIIIDLEDELLENYEDDLSSLFEFMNGGQRNVYDECRGFIDSNIVNINYFDQAKVDELKSILNNPKVYKLSKMPRAKILKTEIEKEFEPKLAIQRANAKSKIDQIISTLQDDENFKKVKESDRYKVIRPLQEKQSQIDNLVAIDSIQVISNDESLFSNGLNRIEELIPDEVVKIDRVNISTLKPQTKAQLKTTQDVEEYISKLKDQMLEQINQNKEILV
jgi:uncharacterized protein YdhG (YjbR/CyaY superfamily)